MEATEEIYSADREKGVNLDEDIVQKFTDFIKGNHKDGKTFMTKVVVGGGNGMIDDSGAVSQEMVDRTLDAHVRDGDAHRLVVLLLHEQPCDREDGDPQLPRLQPIHADSSCS